MGGGGGHSFRRKNTMNAQNPIFGIDSHFTEPPDLWTSRAPGKYQDKEAVTELDADERGNSKR